MFSKSAVVFAFMAVAQLALATPPACILGAVGTQPDPKDFSTICAGKIATNIQAYLSSNCGSQANNAQTVFADTCKQAGHVVAAVSVSPSSTGTAAPTGSARVFTSTFVSDGVTRTTLATATNGAVGAATGSASPSATGAGSRSSAAAAAAGHNTNGILVGGVVALAGFLPGFLAAL